MRDPERIDKILNELREVWIANPDLRLAQMILNTSSHVGPSRLYHVEDDELIKEIKRVLKPRSPSADEDMWEESEYAERS